MVNTQGDHSVHADCLVDVIHKLALLGSVSQSSVTRQAQAAGASLPADKLRPSVT
jgi:hypothetical protein